MPRLLVVAWAALGCAGLLVSGHAVAAPALEAAIDWQGECDDRAALRSELQARGADLNEVTGSETAVKLGIVVRATAAERLLADIQLEAAGSRESRQVEAHDCGSLRSAIAWVLSVFAEERAAAERAGAPSAGDFPSASPVAAPPPPHPPQPATPATRAPPALAAKPAGTSARCAAPGPRLGLGSQLLVGVGLVKNVAFGPAVTLSYRPCPRWFPELSLGVNQLANLGYEVDGRSLRLERSSAQLGAWLTLGTPALRAGLSLEAGRIRATGSAGAQGQGGTGSAPWLAVLLPVRLALPLVPPTLSADVGLDAAYTPLSYALSYASGEVLARPSHFELRGAIGLGGHF